MSRLRAAAAGAGRAGCLVLCLTAGAPPALSSASATGATAAPPPASARCPPLPRLRGEAPADRGLLWELHKDGRRSWLFGTLHVGRPDWARPGPQLAAALAASDVLALELDPAAGLAFPAAPAGGGATGAAAEPATDALPASLRARLAAAVRRACLPPDALAGVPAVVQAAALSLLDARWLGLDPGHAQEHLLALQAREHGVPVVGLETAAQQARMLQHGSPAQVQALVAQTLDQIDDRRNRAVMARLAAAWEAGDLQTLEHFERWCDCAPTAEDRAFLRRMNDSRNPQLAEGIADRHDRGQRVFAAVGALHMTGPASLPLLLARRGFVLRRVLPPPEAPGVSAPTQAGGR